MKLSEIKIGQIIQYPFDLHVPAIAEEIYQVGRVVKVPEQILVEPIGIVDTIVREPKSDTMMVKVKFPLDLEGNLHWCHFDPNDIDAYEG